MVVICSECGFQSRDNDNLQAHMEAHITPRFQRCVACKQIFSCDSDAVKHRMTCDRYLRCASCPRKYVSKRALRLHVAKHIEGRPDSLQLCPLCRTKYPSSQMNEHLLTDHAIDLEEERLWFQNMDDFKQWKNSLEISTRSRYSTRNSRILNNNRKCIQFRCHRDGPSRTRRNLGVRSSKRRTNNPGSIKINAHCPAKMTLTQDILTGVVEVVYVPTHVGHDFCLSRLRLTDVVKRDIVRKLSNNVSFDEILDNSRQDTNLHRHVLTRKTLHNIVRDFKLKNVNYGCGSRSKRKKESKVCLTGDDFGEQEDLISSKESVILTPNSELQSNECTPTDSAGEYQADMDVLPSRLEDAIANNEKINASDPFIVEEADTTCDQLYCLELLPDPDKKLQPAVRRVDSDDDTFADNAGESQAEMEVSSVEKVIANNEQINVREPYTIVGMLADMRYVKHDHGFQDLATLDSASKENKSNIVRGPISCSFSKTTHSKNDHLLQCQVPIKPDVSELQNIKNTITLPEQANRLSSMFLEILGRITNQEQVDAAHESLLSLDAVISNLSDSTLHQK